MSSSWSIRTDISKAVSVALRANATIVNVSLVGVGLWEQPAMGAALVSALTAHPSLRVLSLNKNALDADHADVAGSALGALIAANAPALTVLDISDCDLGDNGLRPLFEALPRNTHLCTLRCFGNGMTAACAREHLLPALRATTSLRTLALLREDGEENDNEEDDEEEEDEEEEEEEEEEDELDAALNEAVRLMQARG
jgi:hypothetical protein